MFHHSMKNTKLNFIKYYLIMFYLYKLQINFNFKNHDFEFYY
jgi:hypothetical protein